MYEYESPNFTFFSKYQILQKYQILPRCKGNCLKITALYEISPNFVKCGANCITICSKNSELEEKVRETPKFEKFALKYEQILAKICQIAEIGAVQKNAHLVNDYLLAKIGVNTAENEPEVLF